MKKRILAVLCAIAMIVTSISISNGPSVKAAEASGTMSLDTKAINGVMGYKSVANGGSGYLNIPYTGVPSDYVKNGQNFLDAAFAEKYITYGGGMTYADLMDGMLSFYVATNSILQLNWANRTNPFTVGWSFTIAKGALLPYQTASGTSYMALDKNYTFTFTESNNGYDNDVTIVGMNTTTFSLGKLSIWGNGLSGGSQIPFTDNNVTDYNTIYTYVQNDENVLDYIRFSGVDSSELAGMGVKIRYILTGSERYMQIEEWGTLRTSMSTGDQIIFYKGLPIQYTDTSGNTWRATLDDTYVYECTGSNSENTQVFYGVKLGDAAEYGIDTATSARTTEAQSDTNPEQYRNLVFDENSTGTIAHNVSIKITEDSIAEDYLQIADYTVAEAKEMGMVLRFIPNANVLQIGFGEAMVDALEPGDTILLKKGLPAVYMYEGVLCAAVLDQDYIFTITANNGTNLSLTWKVAGTYSLSGSTSGPTLESGYSYYAMPILADAFADAVARKEGKYDTDVMNEYVTFSAHSAGDVTSDGTHIRWYIYTSNVYQGLRLYSNLDFASGEVMMINKGLPISYTTTDGKEKVTTLDKDYGFVFDGTKFVYDATLGNEEKEDTGGTTVFDFNGTDFDTSLLEGEGTASLASGCLATALSDTTAVPAGFTDGVYGGGNSNYASVPVAFSAPIDLSKVKSVKVRMYVPEYSASANSQLRILTNESTDSGVSHAAGSYTELGGTFGAWSDVNITSLLKSDSTVKDSEGYLGRFIIGFRTRAAVTCYFDSITISYKENCFVEDDTSFKETTLSKIHSASAYVENEGMWYIYTVPEKPAAVPGTSWVTTFDATYDIDGTTYNGTFIRANNTEGLCLKIPAAELPGGADGITVTVKAGEYASSGTCAGLQITEDFEFYIIDGVPTTDYDFNNPAFTADIYCDVDHATYRIDDADSVTIDGETYLRGDTYDKLGIHSLTYTLHNHEYTRRIILYRLGDVDGNGEINLKDHMAGKNYVSGSRILSIAGEKALDMDDNGRTTATDNTLLAWYLITDSGVLPVYPVDGTITALPSQAAYYLTTDYHVTKADTCKTGEDIYYRNPVTLRWLTYEDVTEYTVAVATSPDMSDKVTYTANGCSLEIENLYADKDYYWTVAAGDYVSDVQTFHTYDTIRTLTVEGVSNTRDGGGWATVDGKKIKQGMFYRGGKLEGITADGLAAMRALGIKTDLDLRNSSETSNVVSPLGEDVAYVNYSGPYYWSDSNGTGINTEAYREALVNEIRLFADEDNYPIYVHCSLGRDRTGTLCFLINALCGVSEEDLCLDYEFSFLSVTGNLDNQTAKNMMSIFDTMYDNVKAYAPNGTMAEATEAFMLSIGVTQDEIDSIRAILIEE